MSDERKKVVEFLDQTAVELRNANEELRAKLDESTGAASEQRAKVEAIEAKLAELEKRNAELDKPDLRPKTELEAEKRSEQVALVRKFLTNGREALTPEEKRALNNTSDADGGFLLQPEFSSVILSDAYEREVIRPVANVNTTSRDSVVIPKMSQVTVAWSANGVQVTSSALSAGQVDMPINSLSSLALLHEDMLSDPDADIEAYLVNSFGGAVAQAENIAFCSGSGVSQPSGVVANTAVQNRAVNSGIAAALVDSTHDGFTAIRNAIAATKEQYAMNGSIAMNRSTRNVLMNVTDANGRPLWPEMISSPMPTTMFGYPVIISEGMPDIGAGTYPIVFGDFQNYWIRDNGGLVIKRLVERYSEFNQIGVQIRKRVGGAVTLAEAFTPVKIAV